MILWFLRLFASFRRAESWAAECEQRGMKLESELQRENADKIRLQDRCRDLEADNLQLRTALQDAQAKTIHSTEMVTDFFSQQMFGRKVYASAPDLPEHPQEADLIPRPRAQARTEVDEITRKFYEDYASREPQE